MKVELTVEQQAELQSFVDDAKHMKCALEQAMKAAGAAEERMWKYARSIAGTPYMQLKYGKDGCVAELSTTGCDLPNEAEMK